MSKINITYICCDVCNTACSTDGRGAFSGTRKDAKEWAGYIRRKGKDVCPECQEEEEEREWKRNLN